MAQETYATIKTNQGDIKLKLYPEIAPKTCENFTTLAKRGYYDGVIFHRVIKEFMIQGGDPTGSGCGGESCWGGTFEDECDPNVKFDRKGLIAMANAAREQTAANSSSRQSPLRGLICTTRFSAKSWRDTTLSKR